MRQLLLTILTLSTLNFYSQKLNIITIDKSKILTTLLDSASKSEILTRLNGRQDNTLRKKWTARTFLLSDGKIVIDFYNKQAALIENIDQFKKLERVQFVKNTIDFLKKNISYKIGLTSVEANLIVQNEKPKELSNFKSDMPDYYDFKVYELATGQILFIEKPKTLKSATIYPDLKTLASDNSTIVEKVYGSQDDEYLMKRLASGDPLLDYETDGQLIYPKYLRDLIKSHKLTLIQQKVYVSSFFGNLYKSENGYYILIDEINQKNGAGNKMKILTLRIYGTLQQVKDAQEKYEVSKNKVMKSEHFYQKISDKYGEQSKVCPAIN